MSLLSLLRLWLDKRHARARDEYWEEEVAKFLPGGSAWHPRVRPTGRDLEALKRNRPMVEERLKNHLSKRKR